MAPHGPTTTTTRPDAGEALLTDPRLTAMGLLEETRAGIAAICEPELEALGLPRSSFEVLVRLGRSPGHRLRMAELTAQCTLTSSGLTRVVDRLVATGLLVREPCPTDRRGWYAVLTAAGRDRLLDVLPTHLDTIDRALTGVLDPDELATFLDALRKIRAVVKPGSDPTLAAPDGA